MNDEKPEHHAPTTMSARSKVAEQRPEMQAIDLGFALMTKETFREEQEKKRHCAGLLDKSRKGVSWQTRHFSLVHSGEGSFVPLLPVITWQVIDTGSAT